MKGQLVGKGMKLLRMYANPILKGNSMQPNGNFVSHPLIFYCNLRFYSSAKSDTILASNEPVITSSLTETPPSEHIQSLVQEICRLSLLETHQLTTVLRKKLGIEATPFPLGMLSQQPNGAASAASMAKPEEPVKTDFKLVLEKFEPTSKAKVIKEVKTLFPQMNLVEAKNFVESLPKVVKEKAPKEEAERLVKVFEAIGAAVKME